jgi:putative DNA primase/helicase
VARFYGTAGPAFLEWLIRQKPDVGERLETTLPNFKADELQPQEARAARRFALVALAGELAREAGIIGWPEGEALKAALACFEQWR